MPRMRTGRIGGQAVSIAEVNHRYNEIEYSYLLSSVLNTGEQRNDRTGVGTRARFGEDLRLNIADNFPLLTKKRVHWKSVLGELLWFLDGANCVSPNCKYDRRCASVYPLQQRGVTIWDEWADENGCLGPIYGVQWESQLDDLVVGIKSEPTGRRHILSAWNPEELGAMALPPCHMMAQFYVSNDGHLDCQMYQRSADMFLGVPFNIASYAALTYMIAHLTGLRPRSLIIQTGDVHIYENHVDQVMEYLRREAPNKEVPTLTIVDRGQKSLRDFTENDFQLENYSPLSSIKADVAV